MKMKRLATTLLMLCVVVCVVVCVVLPIRTNAYSEQVKEGLYLYEVEDGCATIVACDRSASGEIIVPSTLGGYPVTQIGGSAFRYCDKITQVTIPEGVVSIGADAFEYCYLLNNLYLPASVTEIHPSAFDMTGTVWVNENNPCYSNDSNGVLFNKDKTELVHMSRALIDAYSIPDSVTSIGDYAFVYSQLSKLVLPNTVTRIGDYAFWRSRVSVTISDSVTEIGRFAFSECEGVWGNITIPGNVKKIGDSAFENCIFLESVTLDYGVEQLGENVFLDCCNLTNITIPDSVVRIGNKAFQNTAWYDAIPNGMVYAGNVLYRYKGTCPEHISLKAGTTAIADYAFAYCSNLKTIEIPSSLKTVGISAFVECSQLKSIVLPEGTTEIGGYAFAGCSNLAECNLPSSIRSVGNAAFENCSSLTSMAFPYGMTEISDDVLNGCSQLTSVTIPASVTRIGRNAFFDCSSLQEVALPAGVTELGNRAFQGCSSLTSIVIPEGITRVGQSEFHDCSSLVSITIPKSVTYIDVAAFQKCTNLTEIYISDLRAWCEMQVSEEVGYGVTHPMLANNKAKNLYLNGTLITDLVIPAGTTAIAEGAFSNCTKLTSVTIPAGVAEISNESFRSCTGLTNIVIPESVTSIGSDAFASCSGLTTLEIPSSVASIGGRAFAGCSNLTSMNIPASVTEIGEAAFDYCDSLEAIWVDSENPNYSSDAKGVLLDKGQTQLLHVPAQISGDYVMPATVTSIPEGAFRRHDQLVSVVISPAVTDIGVGAFEFCSSLTSVTIPEGVSVITYNTFRGCSQLLAVTIPNGVTSIESGAFELCSSLASVKISASVTYIDEYAFNSCTSLAGYWVDSENPIYSSDAKGVLFNKDKTELLDVPVKLSGDYMLPPTITQIPDSAFSGCHQCNSITIPEGVISIGNSAFRFCNNLFTINIPSTVTRIGDDAFSRCDGINNVTYCGTPEQWDEIEVGTNNTYLLRVNRRYHRYKEATCTMPSYCMYCGLLTGEQPAGHTYENGVDGFCTVCGESSRGPIQWAGSSVTLGGALSMNFAFDISQLNGTTGHCIVLTRTYADGRAYDVVTIPQSEWVSAGGTFVQVSYTNMAAKEMGDKITAVIYNAKGQAISETRSDSMAEYSMRMLARDDIIASPEKRTLFVDMLNYGAAAQVYFGYDAENLVNAALTEEQAGWASKAVQIENYRQTSGCYVGSNLSLEEEIYLQVAFNAVCEEGMYAVVSFTDHYGKLVEKTVEVEASGNYSIVRVEGMAIADYRGLVTCTLYSAEGAELGSTIDSIESYAARMVSALQKNGVDLGDAIMKLGYSSYAFFH